MLDHLNVVIVGMGLMGGSLARALRPHVARLVAVDRDAATRDVVLAVGMADQVAATLDEVTLGHDDLLVLATPVGGILDTLRQLPALAPEGCMVIDLGSTKWDICRAMNVLPGWFQAIGGHPMCGRETSGFGESAPDLFHNQTFILTPTVHTTPHLRELAQALVRQIGARPLIVPPKEHDQTVALVSHVPYLLAATLIQHATQASEDAPLLWEISASGFRDVSRLAGSSPAMMRDILLTNRAAILRDLDRYQRQLALVRRLVDLSDADMLNGWLAEKQREYQAYRAQVAGRAAPDTGSAEG